MFGHRWARILAALGLLAAVGVIATVAYNAGAMHSGGGTAGMGYGYGGGGFGHGGGFVVFRVLFGIFAVVLLLKLFRMAVFGPRQWSEGWGGGHMGPGGGGWSGRRAMLEQWHSEAHAQQSADGHGGAPAADAAGERPPTT